MESSFPGPPRGPPVTGSLGQLLAIDINQDCLPSVLWPLYTLKVRVSLTYFGKIVYNAHYDQRILRGPSSLISSELAKRTVRCNITLVTCPPKQPLLILLHWGKQRDRVGRQWARRSREPSSLLGLFPYS